MRSRWSAIFVGSIVGLASEIGLLLLGLGIGLFAVPLDRSQPLLGFGIGAAIWFLISVILSYFFGGFVASRLHEPIQKGEICFQGLAMWGTACCASILFFFLLINSPLAKVTGLAAAAPSIA